MPQILGLELSTSIVRAIVVGPNGADDEAMQAEVADTGVTSAEVAVGISGSGEEPLRVIEAFAQLQVDLFEPEPGSDGSVTVDGIHRPAGRLGVGDRILGSLDMVLDALPNARGLPTALAYIPAIGTRNLNRAIRHIEGLGIGPVLEVESQRAERVGQAAFRTGTLQVPIELTELYDGLHQDDLAVVAGAALGLRGDGAEGVLVEVGDEATADSDSESDPGTQVEVTQGDDDTATDGPVVELGSASAEIAEEPELDSELVAATDDQAKYDMFSPGETDMWSDDPGTEPRFSNDALPRRPRQQRSSRLAILLGVALIVGGLALLWSQVRAGRPGVGQATAEPTETVAEPAATEPAAESVPTGEAEGQAGTAADAGSDDAADADPAGSGSGAGVAEADTGAAGESGEPDAGSEDGTGTAGEPDAGSEGGAGTAGESDAGTEGGTGTAGESDTEDPAGRGADTTEAGKRRAVVDWPLVRLVGSVASVEQSEAQFELARNWFPAADVSDETTVAVGAPSVDNFQMFAPVDALFDPGSDRLDPVRLDFLEALVGAMGDSRETVLSIGVYGPDDPDLAERRAGAVANYMVGRGVSPARVLRIGYGDRLPPEGSQGELVELTILGVLTE